MEINQTKNNIIPIDRNNINLGKNPSEIIYDSIHEEEFFIISI